MTSDDFLRQVSNRPWRFNAAGPDAWDCWHLFRAFQVDVMGRVMPAVDSAASAAARARAVAREAKRTGWAETATPRLGDAVEFRASAVAGHIGIWLPDQGGMVLHAVEGMGVVLESLFRLRAAGQTYRILTLVEG